MKYLRHRNGDVSFRFESSKDELVAGSMNRTKAIREFSRIAGGGIYSLIGHSFEALNEVFDDIHEEVSPVSFGSDTMKEIIKLAIKATLSPFGQGCWKSAAKELKIDQGKLGHLIEML